MNSFFKTLSSKKNSSRGFTLIELLVVIGILGILAAALVATIDPFEQLKKANDANVKNTAVEFVDANIRYYTTHNNMAWAVDTAANGCASEVGGVSGPTATVNLSAATGSVNAGVGTGCVADLIADGELKSAFTSATGVLNQILIVGTTNSVTACFAPQSKAQKNDINTKFTYSGGTFAANASANGTVNGCTNGSYSGATCYWCAQ